MIDDGGSSQDPVLIAKQIFQQCKFLVRQHDLLSSSPHATRGEVQFQIGDLQMCQFGLRISAAQQRPDPGQEFGKGERLGQKLVRSHVEGIAFHKQNKEFALKVLTKYVRTTDREFLEGSYDIFKQDFLPAPYPITTGLEPTYDYVAQTRPDIRNHKPEEFVDASFITELDKSGFIKKLYEGK